MTFRIGLISDVHSSPAPLAQALEIFRREAVDDIICAGDIAGYYDTLAPTIDLLVESGCKAVVGNHDQSYLAGADKDTDRSIRDYLQGLPQTLELELERRRIYVVHASPPNEQQGSGIRLLDQQGNVRTERAAEWRENLADFAPDVLVVGHTHQVFAERIGNVFVVNPGSSVFNHSCMILSLPDLSVRLFPLEGREIVRCWNFGMFYR